MTVDQFGRFGWSDRVGPLRFLRERWACGPRWRPCWARFYASRVGITVQAHTKKGSYAYAGMFVAWDFWDDLTYAQKEDVILSWIKRVQRPGAGDPHALSATDAEWMQELPALHEFLASTVGPDGGSRRTSTLTLFAEAGAWKCFLNDRDQNCSLCASGDTIDAALCALEIMLEGDRVPWRFSDRPAEGNGRRPKKGT